MRKAALTVALLAALAVTPAARAQNIVYFTDFVLGTDQMAAALAGLPGSYSVTTAPDQATFGALLSGGGFDLGILNIQNLPPSSYPAATAALSAFFGGGGRAIVADWAAEGSTFISTYGATFSGINNDTSFTVSAPTLLPGVSTPVSLTNPGWGIFSTGLVASGGSTVMATFDGGGGAAVTLDATGRAYVNGFLNDTFTTGADGVALYTNEIVSLFAAVPEPSTIALSGLAAVGALAGWRLQKRRKTKVRNTNVVKF